MGTKAMADLLGLEIKRGQGESVDTKCRILWPDGGLFTEVKAREVHPFLSSLLKEQAVPVPHG